MIHPEDMDIITTKQPYLFSGRHESSNKNNEIKIELRKFEINILYLEATEKGNHLPASNISNRFSLNLFTKKLENLALVNFDFFIFLPLF